MSQKQCFINFKFYKKLCLNVCFPYALECVNYRAWAARKQRLDECFELQVSRITLDCTVYDFFFTYTL